MEKHYVRRRKKEKKEKNSVMFFAVRYYMSNTKWLRKLIQAKVILKRIIQINILHLLTVRKRKYTLTLVNNDD